MMRTSLSARQLLSASLMLGAMVSLVFVTTACEDKAIGRACDVQAPDAGTGMAVFNGQALECPTRICLKPSLQQGAVNYMTGPYCTAECSKDSDCDGELRSGTNPMGCKTGFVCAVPFEVGALCCKKLCVCKDFLPKEGLATPPSCDKSKGVSTCQNL